MPDHTPRSVWYWLLLLSPAATAILFSHSPFVSINLLLFPSLCLGLGFWWVSREPRLGVRIVLGLLASFFLFVVNGFIALAGCSSGLFR